MDHSTETAFIGYRPTGEQKRFSLRQANRSLPLVRRIVGDVVADYSKLLELQEILELEQRYGSVEYIHQVKEEMGTAVARIQGFLQELQAVGVELRDFARGLVDFPAAVSGCEIFFCWRLGEDVVSYWHYRHEGLECRKPVSELASLRPAAAARRP